jgi:hypothetical protein
MALTAEQKIERAKGAEKALAKLDAALLRNIKNSGPMLIWLGNGEFTGLASRGLAVGRGKNPLSEWLGVK